MTRDAPPGTEMEACATERASIYSDQRARNNKAEIDVGIDVELVVVSSERGHIENVAETT